ncbi:hypothetical protein JD76_05832 [Micromonospora endolithica]|nr:hypothetical protein JD76_05832 [Micromonospora endolithica]
MAAGGAAAEPPADAPVGPTGPDAESTSVDPVTSRVPSAPAAVVSTPVPDEPGQPASGSAGREAAGTPTDRPAPTDPSRPADSVPVPPVPAPPVPASGPPVPAPPVPVPTASVGPGADGDRNAPTAVLPRAVGPDRVAGPRSPDGDASTVMMPKVATAPALPGEAGKVGEAPTTVMPRVAPEARPPDDAPTALVPRVVDPGQGAVGVLPGSAPPAPRRRWALWTALAAVVALLACGLPAALLAGAVGDAGAEAPGGRPRAVSDDPATAAARKLGERMAAQLDRQSSALLRGDRAGWLAVAEPAAHADLRRRFAALRALRVTGWAAEPTGLPTPVDGRPGEWRLLVEFRYCFVVRDCRTSPVLTATRWRDGPAPRLTAVEPSRSAETGTRPWEVSDLVVAVGKRTVVATTPAQRRKLPTLLAQAEAAARTADAWAVGGRVPDRYRVFYAGRSEWQRWYGGGRPKWTGGYAVTVGGGHHEVVLNAEGLTSSGLDDLLRHELTHAASLPERGYPGESTWWLVEGLAEYAGADGRSIGRYPGLADARRLLAGGWDGRLDTLTPAANAPAARVSGSYGISYLAVRHLTDRYGPARLLAFFGAVVHDRRTLDEAAEAAFGEPWSRLHDDCVTYARSVVG